MSVEFFVISLLLALVPGAGVVFALSCALSQGRRGAFWGAVAGAVGVIPHLLAAALGLSALLSAWPPLQETLRLAGGAYLLWLGLQAWLQRHLPVRTAQVREAGGQIVLRGALINLLNPKLTLFFLSFLPQFVPASDPQPVVTLGLMALVLVAQTFVVFLAYGLAAARAAGLVQRQPRLMTLCQSGLAALFAALGLRVLLASR